MWNLVEHDAVVPVRQPGPRRLNVRLPHVHGDAGQRLPLHGRELVVVRREAVDSPILGDLLRGPCERSRVGQLRLARQQALACSRFLPQVTSSAPSPTEIPEGPE
jgi:hypothetical protein